MEELSKEIKDLTDYICNTSAYKKCISLKKQMDENDDLNKLIKEIKHLQQKYVKNSYDEQIKKELDTKVEILNNIPIYVIYNRSLDEVNSMIDYVKDSLNIYFDNLLNKK